MTTTPLPMDREAVIERMRDALEHKLISESFDFQMPKGTALRIAEWVLNHSSLMERIAELEAENDRIKQNHGCARGQRTTQWCGEAAETHAKLRELEAELARKDAALEAVKAHAVAQDCGRMCDANPKIVFREQWKRSEQLVEDLIRQALAPQPPGKASE